MQRIHPVTAENCRAHYGKPVLLYLTDGTEVTGVLSRVQGGRLILNEQAAAGQAAKTVTLKKKKAKTKAKIHALKKSPVAGNSAFSSSAPLLADPFAQPSYAYGYGAPMAFDVAMIAALFVLG